MSYSFELGFQFSVMSVLRRSSGGFFFVGSGELCESSVPGSQALEFVECCKIFAFVFYSVHKLVDCESADMCFCAVCFSETSVVGGL